MGSEDRSRDTYLNDVVQVLFKRKWFILSVFFLVLVGVTIGIMSAPREYEASAMLMLTRARGEHVLTPSQGSDGVVAFRLNPTQDLNAETQLLMRRSLLAKVVESLGAETVIAGQIPPSMFAESNGPGAIIPTALNGNGHAVSPLAALTNATGNGYAASNGVADAAEYLRKAVSSVGPAITMPVQKVASVLNTKKPIPDTDRAIYSLESRLRVSGQENANLIKLALPGTDPQFAAKVLNLLVNQYLEEYPKLRNTPGAADFFERQMTRFATELRDAENAKLTFEAQHGGLNRMSSQQEAYLRTAIERETALQRARSEVDELTEKGRHLRQLLDTQPDKIRTAEEVRPNPVMDAMRGKLVELELQRNNLLQKYTDKERRVQDVEREIALLRSKLSQEPTVEFARESYGQNPTRMSLVLDQINTEAQLRQSIVKAQALERDIKEFGDRLDQVSKAGYERARLERKLKLFEDSYLLYAKKFEEARISAAMDKSQIVNVNLVEPVQVKAKPGVGGKSGVSWMILAGSIGMIAGVGGAFCREFFDHSLSTDQSVKRNVGLPVLGSIPEQRS